MRPLIVTIRRISLVTAVLLVGGASILALLGISRDRNGAIEPAFTIDSVTSPAGPGSAEPNLTVGADGRVYMSWLEPADSGHAPRFSVYDESKA